MPFSAPEYRDLDGTAYATAMATRTRTRDIPIGISPPCPPLTGRVPGWHIARMDLTSPRLRGRAGVARRERMLARFPVCVMCEAEGIYRPTDEIDHVVPLHRGGADDETNLQGLCREHHDAKSLAEQGARVSNHPDWLKPSLIPITILCGPPASGKSTLARLKAGPTHLIVDLDDILLELDPAYRPWSGDRSHLDEAIRVRNRMLGSLAQPSGYDAAWFTIMAPSPDEQRWWHSRLGGELHVLRTSAEECKRRAVARGTPGAVDAVDDWFRRSRLPWSPHRSKVPIGDDGWPVMPSGGGSGPGGGVPSC